MRAFFSAPTQGDNTQEATKVALITGANKGIGFEVRQIGKADSARRRAK